MSAVAYRLDRGALRSPRETAQGFLRVDGYATRVGVLEYSDPTYPGGVRRELRLPEDLFDPASLASYEGASVTDDHPPELVTANNAVAFERGTVMTTARRDGDHVAVDMQIKDAGLIRKVKAGKVELSSGYVIKLDATPGVHPLYGRYDARQYDIRVNHVAVVDVGRAGPTARIRTDSADSPAETRIRMDASALVSCDCTSPPHPPLTTPSVQDFTMADKTNTTPNQNAIAELYAAEKLRADGAESKLTAETARADKAEGQVAVLNATVEQLRLERRDDAVLAAKDAEIKLLTERLDASQREVNSMPEKLAAGIKERVELERKASRVLGADARFDGLSDRDVIMLVLEKRGVSFDPTRTDAHLRGSFETTVANHAAGEAALRSIATNMPAVDAPAARTDSNSNTPLSPKQARDRMVAAQRNAWKSAT